MDAITVNGTDTGLTGRTAILDTGTTLIIAPPSDAQKVMQSLGGACDAQQCMIPCTTQASLALSFGNASFAIDPRDLAVLPVDPNNPTGTCTAGIQPQQIGAATEWLVSDACPSILGRPLTKRSGWGCFPEERLLLYQRRDEPDLTCEADYNLIVPSTYFLTLSGWADPCFCSHALVYLEWSDAKDIFISLMVHAVEESTTLISLRGKARSAGDKLLFPEQFLGHLFVVR